MTILQSTLVHPNPGVAWDDVQKQLKRASQLAKKHGGENVTVLATVVGGPTTNAIAFLTTAKDWATYGKIQESLSNDQDYQALLIDAGQIATWENFLSQTIEV
jgi:hypothetical protein